MSSFIASANTSGEGRFAFLVVIGHDFHMPFLKIKRLDDEKVPNVELSGVIDEGADFSSMSDVSSKEFHIDLNNVTRINSVGVRKWIKHLEGLTEKGIKLFFYRVSPAMTEQFNYISNFSCGGALISVAAPFHCVSCHKSVLLEKFRKEVFSNDFESSLLPCPYCKKNGLKFDDDLKGYFSFWAPA